MTPRYANIRQLVELRANIRQFPTLADEHIANTIIESLPPKHRAIYYWILENECAITSADVEGNFDISCQFASSLLKELVEFELLEREAIVEGSHYFAYRVKA